MAVRLVVSGRAVREIGEAYEWYERQVPGLRADFLAVLDAQLETAKSSSSLYGEILPGVRRALLRRFPYGVFYATKGELISVLAVVHTARSPRRWPGR